MAVEDCNVKENLKLLIGLHNKVSISASGNLHAVRNEEKKRNPRRTEEALWTVLLCSLNSPYVTSTKTVRNDVEIDDADGENSIYDELWRHAFYLKMKGLLRNGLKMEEKAGALMSQRVNHRLVKFLLCLSNIEIEDIYHQRLPDFYNAVSSHGPLGQDTQLEEMSSNWIMFDLTEERERQQRFFNFEVAPACQLGSSNIFQDKPGSHFMGHFSIHMPNEMKAGSKKEPSLFGALSNQHNQDSLDMVLSLPDMPCDSLALISRSASIDEGFIDETPSSTSSVNTDLCHDHRFLNDELQIWTDCLASNGKICRTWDRLTRFWSEVEAAMYLAESGPIAFDHLYQLRQNEITYVTNELSQKTVTSMDVLVRHSVNVLCGLPSDVFVFNKATCCFVVEASVRTPGLSSEATHAILEKFAEIGTYYRQLSRFTRHHSERLLGFSGGLTLESFVSSLCKYLDLYKFAILVIQENMPTNFLKLWAISFEFGAQMRFLAEICLCSVAFGRTKNTPRPKFPVGLKLISYLYDLCNRNKSTIHYRLLVNLFKDACIPFIRYLSKWIYDGKCHDPYNEFLFDVDHQYLCYRDKHYWTHGYVLKENRSDIMIFDADFIEQIYACGKAINLLKQGNRHHYLLRNDLHPPQIELKLSVAEIEKVYKLSEEYSERVIEAKGKEVIERELQMEDILQRQREEIAADTKKHRQMIQNINEMEAKIKEAVQMKKFKELQRLKEQMENAIEKRKADKEKQLLEDKEILRQGIALDEKRDEAERKAREELVSYYEDLTKQATAREDRALWTIKRYELHVKRKNFLQNEQLKLTEEKEKHDRKESEGVVGVNRNSTEENEERNLYDNSDGYLNSEEIRLKLNDNVDGLDNEELGTEKKEKHSEIGTNDNVDDFVREFSGEGSNHDKKIDEKSESYFDVCKDQNGTDFRKDDDGKDVIEKSEIDLVDVADDDVVDVVDDNVVDVDVVDDDVVDDDVVDDDVVDVVDDDVVDVVDAPNRNVRRKERKLWEIEHVSACEPKTVIKSILYPDVSEDSVEVPFKSSRGKEPKVTIKELIYHQEIVEEEVDLPVIPWAENEISYDVTLEHQQIKEMTSIPQPYLLDSLLNKTHFHENHEDEEPDIIKDLSLDVILHRSLVIPVAVQIELVQTAAVEYMMDSLQIGVHFDAFRKYLLLEDGEFGLSLCNQIFEKAFGNMLTPKEFSKPANLNSIINQALQFSLFGSKLELSRNLSFSLKYIPEFFNSTDINILDFLQLRYKVPWPCNIIITENSIAKYNKVFSFLLRLKMVNWSLQRVWRNLKRAGRSDRSKLSPQIRKLQLYRHEMQHFTNNIERYLVNQIIHISWQEFQDDLQKNVHNIDDLHKYHVNYLNRIIFRSLLNKNAAPVLKIISDIFTLVLKFHHQLLSSDWKENGNGFIEHQCYRSLCTIYNGFRQYSQFLFKVVAKLIRRGYQNHLDHLLLQVNFNGCYDYETS